MANSQGNDGGGYSDRRAILTGIGLFTVGAAAYLAAPKILGNVQLKDKRYFDAKKLGETTYVEYQGKVFEVRQRLPTPLFGFEKMVREENPNYDNAALKEIGELAVQLYRNPELANLKNGVRKRIYFDGKKRVNVQDKVQYPSVTEIGRIKSLDDLVL